MIQLALAGGVAALLYLAIKPAEPKSMPLTLPGQKGDFVNAMITAIYNVLPGIDPVAAALMTAHAAYESAWGKTTAWKNGNNPFNITRVQSSTLPIVEGPDTECTPDNQCRPITQRFAAYGSLEEAIQDYLAFIGRFRYSNAKQLLLAGDIGFLEPLYAGGYFTQPLPIYQANMQSVFNQVNAQLSNA